MRYSGSKSLKDYCTKWLLSAVLLWTISTALGPAALSPIKGQPAQATLTFRVTGRAVKTINYAAFLQNAFERQSAGFVQTNILNISSFHSLQVAVSLRRFRKVRLVSDDKIRLIVVKTIPQNGKNDPVLATA